MILDSPPPVLYDARSSGNAPLPSGVTEVSYDAGS